MDNKKHITRQNTTASLGRANARPCARRYMYSRIFLSLALLLPSLAASQEMTANQAMLYWSDRFKNAIPSYSHDYEIDAWASKNGIKFEFSQPSEDDYIQGEYLYKARLGKYKVETPDWECSYQSTLRCKQSSSAGRPC